MIKQFCDWLAATPLSQTFQDLLWFVPTVQTLHILSIAVVTTGVGMLAFKLMGLAGRSQTLAAMASGFLPWIWRALAVLLTTGILLTVTEPARELLNILFRIKMLLVSAIAILLITLQISLRNDPNFWGRSPVRRASARALGGVALILLANIIVAGRWIAYI